MASNSFASLASLLRGAATQAPTTTNTGRSREGQSKIGSVFVFNLPTESDGEFVNELMRRAASPERGSVFLHFLRVQDEPFGVTEFRTASAAYRAARALSGLPLLGRQVVAVCDKRTQVLADQWKYSRGRELATTPGIFKEQQVNNILDLVEADINNHIARDKAEMLEFLRSAELRLKGGDGGPTQAVDKFRRQERDRMQEMLVRQAETRSALETAKATLKDLTGQVRKVETQLETADREIERKQKEFVSHTARTNGGKSLFELKQLLREDEEEEESSFSVDWEYVMSSKSRVMQTLRAWVETQVQAAMAGHTFQPLVEYILRRTIIDRVSPEEFTLDLKNYLDDQAEPLVQGIHHILLFESLRRRHCPKVY